MTYKQCPACNGKRMKQTENRGMIYECSRCKAIFGDCYLGDSYGMVLPYLKSSESVPQDRIRYFDFMTLGSEGLKRRHGWFDTADKMLVQVG